jgi:hypothetical protein
MPFWHAAVGQGSHSILWDRMGTHTEAQNARGLSVRPATGWHERMKRESHAL